MSYPLMWGLLRQACCLLALPSTLSGDDTQLITPYSGFRQLKIAHKKRRCCVVFCISDLLKNKLMPHASYAFGWLL